MASADLSRQQRLFYGQLYCSEQATEMSQQSDRLGGSSKEVHQDWLHMPRSKHQWFSG